MMLDILLTSAIPLLLLFTALWGSKKDSSGTYFFSKEYTRTLKGLCAIVVMMVHIPEEFGNPLQDVIGSFAFVAVTCFFLISAYGMHYSLAHKSDYLSHFWRNRVVSLLAPQLLVNIIGFIAFGALFISNLTSEAPDPLGLLHLDSYVLLLLLYCLVFYVCALLFNKRGKSACVRDAIILSAVAASSLTVYFISQGEGFMAVFGWPYERIGLIWGVLLFLFFDGFTSWLQKDRVIKLVVFSTLCLCVGFLYLKYKTFFFWGEYMLKVLLGVLLIILLFLISRRFTFTNRLSRFFGDISYEMYLLHLMVYSVVAELLPDVSSGIFILLTFAATILLSYLTHIIAIRIMALLRQ